MATLPITNSNLAWQLPRRTLRKHSANLLLARARILPCFAQVNLGDAEKARPLCEEAKKINLSAGDQLGAARATNDIANSCYYAGKYAAAEPLTASASHPPTSPAARS